MELKHFDGQNKKELSMIEVAHAILEEEKEVLDFSELMNQLKEYLELSSDDVLKRASQFYTDLNIDGSFISLGENRWGLRSWYPIDSIDEEVTQGNEDDMPRRKKRKKTSAFVSDDEIDYNDDDPEDEADLADDDTDDADEIEYGDTVEVDEHGVMVDDEDEEDLGKYKEDLSEIGADDDDDELPDGVEGDLSIIDDEDSSDEDDEEGY